MKMHSLVVMSLALLLAQSAHADSTAGTAAPAGIPSSTPAVPAGMTGNPQQRMQAFQAMSPEQRQAAMQTMKTNMQGKMGSTSANTNGMQGNMTGMRSRMRARMGGGGSSVPGAPAQ